MKTDGSDEIKSRERNARHDGLTLFLLGSVVFVLLGVALESVVPGPMSDFKAVYFSARCLLEHKDPYKSGEILSVYQAEGGKFPSDPEISRSVRRAILVCINLPTALFLVVPLAMLSWGAAHLLWMGMIAAGLVTAAFLMWKLGAEYAAVPSGALMFLLLANSEVVLVIGNAAGVAISLCLIAAWCFLKNRYASAGVVCLGISLVLKPHDAGLVWFYFLLAGGVYRKRALQTLAVVIVLAVPPLMWVSTAAPHWMGELHNNLLQASAHGDLNDPGPASMSARSLGMIVSLQSAISLFRDDPGFYNPVSYLICAPLLLGWTFVTLRTRATPRGSWLALASIAALTMLPVYHRQYDAKLLLLAVPACAMLWTEGGSIGRLGMLITTAALVFTGDLTQAVLLGLTNRLHLAGDGLSGWPLAGIQVFPAPLTLLLMGVFYLWVYALGSKRVVADTDAPTDLPHLP